MFRQLLRKYRIAVYHAARQDRRYIPGAVPATKAFDYFSVENLF